MHLLAGARVERTAGALTDGSGAVAPQKERGRLIAWADPRCAQARAPPADGQASRDGTHVVGEYGPRPVRGSGCSRWTGWFLRRPNENWFWHTQCNPLLENGRACRGDGCWTLILHRRCRRRNGFGQGNPPPEHLDCYRITKDEDRMSTSPIRILKDAQESIPAVRYAAGVAGLAAVVAIVAGFQLDYRVAVFGTLVVFGLMFVLLIFSSLVSHSGPALVGPARFAAWSFLVLTVAASLFLMTSYFFSWPRPLGSYVGIPPTPEPIEVTPTPDTQNVPATGYVRLSSEPGDYIGQGQEYEFSNNNGLFRMGGNRNSISIVFQGDNTWSLGFAAPQEQTLNVGRYSPAQRVGVGNPVRPGIAIFGAGRGCNEVSGSFVVQDIAFGESDAPERFVAEFEQRCENGSSVLRGEVNIRANE